MEEGTFHSASNSSNDHEDELSSSGLFDKLNNFHN